MFDNSMFYYNLEKLKISPTTRKICNGLVLLIRVGKLIRRKRDELIWFYWLFKICVLHIFSNCHLLWARLFLDCVYLD